MPSFDQIGRWLAGERVRADVPPADRPDPVGLSIARAIEERIASFTLGDALRLPTVARAVDLLCSQAAALSPVVLFDGLPTDPQPRLVTRPTPWAGETRHDFIYGTVYSLLAGPTAGWRCVLADDRPRRARQRDVAAAAGFGRSRRALGRDPAAPPLQLARRRRRPARHDARPDRRAAWRAARSVADRRVSDAARDHRRGRDLRRRNSSRRAASPRSSSTAAPS